MFSPHITMQACRKSQTFFLLILFILSSGAEVVNKEAANYSSAVDMDFQYPYRCQVLSEKPGQNPMGPQKVIDTLNECCKMCVQIRHVHRSKIDLIDPPAPVFGRQQKLLLKSLLRAEGHAAVKQRFGLGPWGSGLENKPLDFDRRNKF